jgi:hypothetical protein
LFERLKNVAMPEIPFDALNQFQRRLAEFTLLITFADFYRQALGGLHEYGEPHRKVKPIEYMFGFRAQIELQIPHILAAV